MISHDDTRKPSERKFSKDHLDAVLSVDARSDLQLFCSSRLVITYYHEITHITKFRISEVSMKFIRNKMLM